MNRTFQNSSKFSKRSLKERNSAVSDVADSEHRFIQTSLKPRILVLSGYGINCERETKHAFDMVGGDAEIVHVNDLINKEKNLEDFQILAIPGGFSYGDDTGSGNALANKIRLNLWGELRKFIDSEKLVIGICNGFQVLTNLGLLPALSKNYGESKAALTFNNSTRYECRWTNLKQNSNKCVFTKNILSLRCPVAHGEGKFFTDPETLEELKKNDQIVFTYTKPNGENANEEFPYNPNGALFDIAGICDETGRILGMMPHPERAILMGSFPDFHMLKEKAKREEKEISEYYGPAVSIFQNAVDYAKDNLQELTTTVNKTEEDFLDSLGNKVSGILSVPDGAALVVILSHGFTSNKDSKNYEELEKKLNDLGIGTLRYDYYGHGPGYGHGHGYGVSKDVTLSKVIESLKASIRFVRKKGDYDIVLLGSSFGGLISMICASEDNEIKGLILKSPVTEPLNFWRNRLSNEEFEKWRKEGILYYNSPPEKFDLNYDYWLDLQNYDSLKLAKLISCKTLIIHGDDDVVVPIEQSRKLAKIIGTDIKVVTGAGHFYDLPEQHNEMMDTIIKFLVNIQKIDLSSNIINKNRDKFNYIDAGVNIELGGDVSKILYNAAKETWINRKGKLGELIVPFDDFSGVRAIDVSNLPSGTLMNIGFDGVGTKTELAERINDHSTIAFDLFAMVCDDAVVRGAEPVLVGSILETSSLGEDGETYIEQVKQLAKGYIEAAKAANVAIVNGEVAEMGNRVGGFGPFNYNWGAAVVWFTNKDKLFTGREIKVGDTVVAFKEKGFRSNGLSLVRKVFQEVYGDDWHIKELNGISLGKLALTPSKIYSKTIIDAYGGMDNEGKAEIHGMAHITGGGIPEKLRRILKVSGLGAELDDLFEPSEVMLHCQEIGNIDDKEAYSTWNMGNGMLVITPEPEKIIQIAMENGVDAKIAGKITTDKQIKIRNKGVYNPREGLGLGKGLEGPEDIVVPE